MTTTTPSRKLILSRPTLNYIEVYDQDNDDSYMIGFNELPIFCAEVGVQHKYEKVHDKMLAFGKVMIFNNKVYDVKKKHQKVPVLDYRLVKLDKRDDKRIIDTLDRYYDYVVQQDKLDNKNTQVNTPLREL
jgi:hypothetical protein